MSFSLCSRAFFCQWFLENSYNLSIVFCDLLMFRQVICRQVLQLFSFLFKLSGSEHLRPVKNKQMEIFTLCSVSLHRPLLIQSVFSCCRFSHDHQDGTFCPSVILSLSLLRHSHPSLPLFYSHFSLCIPALSTLQGQQIPAVLAVRDSL